MQSKVINIGIDFGTCYSKVCFEDETKQKNYVKFYTNKSEYKHSEIYYEYSKKMFYYIKPENVNIIETVKYFKYSTIEESLPRSIHIPVSQPITSPEILCCVFFIACLIEESIKYIENFYEEKYGSMPLFDYSITMGVPIDNYSDKFRPMYDIILQIAIELSKSNKLDKNSISLNDLDNFYQDNKKISPPKFKESSNNILSELYAECLAFLEDKNVPEGLFAIIDIGGATVDMAVINKSQVEANNKFKYSIIAENIQPLGIEILIQKIIKSDDMYNMINELLKNDNFQSTDIEYNKIEEQELSKRMQKAFAEMAINAKDKFRKALIKRKGEMKVILCGGGAKYEWYKKRIKSTQEQIRKTISLDEAPNGFKLKLEDVGDLGRYYNSIDHRLIISSGLAQDIQRIPDLDGFPWDYSEIRLKEKNIDEINYNKQIELFGKTN